MLQLHNKMRAVFEDEPTDRETGQIQVAQGYQLLGQSHYRRSLLYCTQASALLRIYRETHGLGVVLPFVFQASTLVCFTLVQDVQKWQNLNKRSHGAKADNVDLTTESRADEAWDEANVAFEEGYRCLLGMATQVMMARAVVRMLYHTLNLMGVTMHEPMDVLAERTMNALWRTAETKAISSSYPNYALVKQGKASETERMEILLGKWENMMA